MGYQRIAGQNPDSSQFRYARIHEFGSGYLPGGVIRPLTAPFLVFRVNSSQNIVKTGVTFSPGAVNQVWVRTKQVRIPARPFLRPAANGIRSEVRQVMNKAIADAIGGV
jgi:phage gpG-like protein